MSKPFGGNVPKCTVRWIFESDRLRHSLPLNYFALYHWYAIDVVWVQQQNVILSLCLQGFPTRCYSSGNERRIYEWSSRSHRDSSIPRVLQAIAPRATALIRCASICMKLQSFLVLDWTIDVKWTVHCCLYFSEMVLIGNVSCVDWDMLLVY